jgi:hypothetical protein
MKVHFLGVIYLVLCIVGEKCPIVDLLVLEQAFHCVMNFKKGIKNLMLEFMTSSRDVMMESKDFMNDHHYIVHFVVGFHGF